MAAPFVSVIASVVAAALMFLYFRYEFDKAHRRGEHFEAEGDILRRIEQFEKGSWAAPVDLGPSDGTHYPADQSVWHGSVLRSSGRYRPGSAVRMEEFADKLRTFNEGVAAKGGTGYGHHGGIGGLWRCGAGLYRSADHSGNHCFSSGQPDHFLSLAASFAGILTGNGGGGADVAMNILSGQYLAMGRTAGDPAPRGGHCDGRIQLPPHNGMLITVSDTCGFSAKECYRYIFVSTVLVSLAGLLVTVGLGCVLYPVG